MLLKGKGVGGGGGGSVGQLIYSTASEFSTILNASHLTIQWSILNAKLSLFFSWKT